MVENLSLTSEQAKLLIAKHGRITLAGIRELLHLPREVKKIKIHKPNKNLSEIKFLLRDAGIDFVEEFSFHPKRKWRFDLAIPHKKIYFEYEGIFSRKSRHTTVTGYSGDVEKYNEAAKLGWVGLRYTALNFTNVISDVLKILEQ